MAALESRNELLPMLSEEYRQNISNPVFNDISRYKEGIKLFYFYPVEGENKIFGGKLRRHSREGYLYIDIGEGEEGQMSLDGWFGHPEYKYIQTGLHYLFNSVRDPKQGISRAGPYTLPPGYQSDFFKKRLLMFEETPFEEITDAAKHLEAATTMAAMKDGGRRKSRRKSKHRKSRRKSRR